MPKSVACVALGTLSSERSLRGRFRKKVGMVRKKLHGPKQSAASDAGAQLAANLVPFRRSGDLFVRPEHEIEPGLPSLTGIGRSECRFAHDTIHRFPDAADTPLLSRGCAIRASENHSAVLHVAFDDEELPAIGDPALMPNSSRSIVNAEALALVAVNALIIFVNDAAIEDALDANLGVLRGLGEVERVPIAKPEVEFVVFGG